MNARMLSLCFVLLSLWCAAPALASDGDDTPALREAATRRYLSVVPVQKMIDEMISGVKKTIPVEQQSEFDAFIRKTLRADFIERISVNGMVKTFTVREIDAMTAFYGTPEGRSIQNKMGTYMAEVMPEIQQEMVRALQEMMNNKDKSKQKSTQGSKSAK